MNTHRYVTNLVENLLYGGRRSSKVYIVNDLNLYLLIDIFGKLFGYKHIQYSYSMKFYFMNIFDFGQEFDNCYNAVQDELITHLLNIYLRDLLSP